MTEAVVSRSGWSQTFELMLLLVLKDLRVRYKSSFLGYIWALANPLATTVVYYIAFGLILQVQMPNYALYMVTGLFPWMWMSGALVQATASYRANESLVRKVQLPRASLPLSSALQEMLHFFFACPILLAAVFFALGRIHVSWLVLVPLMALVQLALVYPLCVLLASLNVVVHDVQYIVGIVLQLVFFLTPIVYPEASIPVRYLPYFRFNPFVPLVAAWRKVFYEGTLDPAAVGRVLLFAAGFVAAALLVHRKIEPRIGELL